MIAYLLKPGWMMVIFLLIKLHICVCCLTIFIYDVFLICIIIAPSAQAVAESCWISNLPHSPIWLPNQKIVLLSGMCPVENNVKLERLPLQSKLFSFSFMVCLKFIKILSYHQARK